MAPDYTLFKDPFVLKEALWPDVRFYREQNRIIESVWANDETIVPAANMMGKDFVAGFIALAYFLTKYPCRVITTSVKEDHLRVLWGEIGRFIQTSKVPLDEKLGGPLVLRHLDIRRKYQGKRCEISYLLGLVAGKGESMAGHHARYTLGIIDEASGVEDIVYTQMDTWGKRKLIFGNPMPTTNFFRKAVKQGPIPDPSNGHLYQNVIKIRAEDSPNVRVGLERERRGLPPVEDVLPGVLSYAMYKKRRATWDKIRQCIGLDGEFYEGAENLLFPPEWINIAEQRAREIKGRSRKAKAIGIDPAEGGDKTSMVAVDELGVIEVVSKKTADTSVITGEAIAFMLKQGVPAQNVVFDRGGGGKQHADIMRKRGYNVRTVAFGESVGLPMRRGRHPFSARLDVSEDRYTYKNRRAEMYGTLRILIDPSLGDDHPVFGIPAEFEELRRQMAPIELHYDEEGRMVLPPKNKRDSNDTRKTLVEVIGHSPDELDALVMAVWGMVNAPVRTTIGAF